MYICFCVSCYVEKRILSALPNHVWKRVMEGQQRNNFVVGSLKLSPGVMVFVGVME